MNENKKLFHKDFILVVIGQIISLFGNGILRFAFPLYILQESGSPALFGVVSACSFIPMVIMSPFGGIIADRVNKQRIMVILDFITAALIIGFMILSTQFAIVPLIVITLMLLYGIQGTYSPAVQASIPLLASEENLMPANATVNLVQSLSGLLGPVIGGILFGNFGLTPILVVGAICFAFSAILELFIKIPHTKQPAGESAWQIVKDDMKVSMDFIFKKFPIIAKVVMLICLINLFLSSMLIIGLPVIVTSHLMLSSELYGINQGGLAIGGLLGGVLAGVLGNKISVQNAWKLLLVSSVVIFPMGIVLFLGIPKIAAFWIITVCGTFIMVCATIFSIRMLAFVQEKTPVELVGKVISCILAVSTCAQPIGQTLYGGLFEWFAAMPGVVIIGAGVVSAIISLYMKGVFGQLSNEPMGV